MKKLILASVFACLIQSAHAAEPNFQCKLFGDGVSGGSLILSGEDMLQQDMRLTVATTNQPSKTFEGKVYLRGSADFTSLDMTIQEKIVNGMNQSRRPNLKTGNLVVFGNTQDSSSTLNFYMMPSGQIAYLQIGLLEALCM